MDRLRFGVLGAARIATHDVVPAMQDGARTRVVAIASRTRARAEAVASEFGIDRVHERYEDVVSDPDVDAVYVPLPNHLHAEWSIAAARAGKHVLCEKPMAMDADEARRVVAACRDAGVTFMEAFMYRTHPQWHRVRELLADGVVGELRSVHAHFSYANDDPDDYRNSPEYGGGGLLDVGCYCIDVARLVFDEDPVGVHGTVEVDERFGTDVLASAVLRFPGGRHATFTCGTRSAPDQHVRITGTSGTLAVDRPFNPPPDRPATLRVVRDSVTVEEVVVAAANQYTLQGDAFAAAVLDGAPPPVPPDTGPAVLAVIDELHR